MSGVKWDMSCEIIVHDYFAHFLFSVALVFVDLLVNETKCSFDPLEQEKKKKKKKIYL